jgi:Type I phosphodiesterase / nucleotide pyrophosphatase
MKRHARGTALLLAAFTATAYAAAPEKKPAAPPAAVRAPQLAVIIAVDGLGWPRLEKYRPWYVAGLKRLLDEGWIERSAKYQHLNTETGPGHAALGTGAPPRVTGIVTNNWFERTPEGTLKTVYCTDQRDASGAVFAGPARLRVPTLGDRLVEARPQARVVSISGKDRAAIFLAGKNPRHAVYWYDQETGRFVTSPAYDAASPAGSAVKAIVGTFNQSKAGGMLPGRFGLVWKKLAAPPPASPKPLPTPVPAALIQKYQWPTSGLGFDHDLSKYGVFSGGGAAGYFGGIYRSPLVDELTMDLALAVLNDSSLELGHRDVPEILSLSFSGHDCVSHDYGNESEEELDVLRRLDVQLGRLFEVLDESFPKGTVMVAFSADHGFPPMPEVARQIDRTYKGGRLPMGRDILNNFRARLNRLVDEELCLDSTFQAVQGIDGWDLFYSPKLPARSVEGSCGPAGRLVTASDVDGAVSKIVKRVWKEEVQDVYLVSARGSWPAGSVTEFVNNDFDKERSGDAILIPRPGVMTSYSPDRGSMHGSHYDFDTHVPLVFWGGPAPAGSSSDPATPYDLAPTVGAWLGVTLPDAVGKPLPLPR